MTITEEEVTMPGNGVHLHADIGVPVGARGIVVFAHGSGSSRKSPRNREVAAALQRAQFATLLLDLLTLEEERVDELTRQMRFDIPFLAERLAAATSWVQQESRLRTLPIGY